MKEELLASITKIVDEDYSELKEEVKDAKEPKEAISVIKHLNSLSKEKTKKIINIVGKQGELLK